MKNGGEFKEIGAAAKKHSSELDKLAQELISKVKELRIRHENAIKELPTPTVEERIEKMEKMYNGNYPLILKKGIMENIIKLRTKKLIKDYC